jgi:hypothetical protein
MYFAANVLRSAMGNFVGFLRLGCASRLLILD